MILQKSAKLVNSKEKIGTGKKRISNSRKQSERGKKNISIEFLFCWKRLIKEKQWIFSIKHNKIRRKIRKVNKILLTYTVKRYGETTGDEENKSWKKNAEA